MKAKITDSEISPTSQPFKDLVLANLANVGSVVASAYIHSLAEPAHFRGWYGIVAQHTLFRLWLLASRCTAP
jgi:hypothetical protein